MEIHVEQHNQKDIATYIKDILAETEVEGNPTEEKRQILMEQLIQQANGCQCCFRQKCCVGEPTMKPYGRPSHELILILF